MLEPRYRRGGHATEALTLLLQYVTGNALPARGSAVTLPEVLPNAIPPASLVVRIGDKNAPSISLFRKLGFEIVKRVEVFEEVEMRISK